HGTSSHRPPGVLRNRLPDRPDDLRPHHGLRPQDRRSQRLLTGAVVPQPPDMGSSRADERARRSAAGDGKTRVLVLIKGLGIGGAERLIASGSAYWNTRRFVYHVAYVLPWKGALVSEMRKRGIGVAGVGGRRGCGSANPLPCTARVALSGLLRMS